MFKNALKIATTFGLLVAAYAVYVHSFGFVVGALGQRRQGPIVFNPVTSAHLTRAKGLSTSAFGADHWTSDTDLMRFYNAERGFWMYAASYKRLNEGKQVEFTPFALIWLSRDGKVLKSVTSKTAVVDLAEPFALNSSGPIRVIHARLEDDVRMRDDKGTPDDRSDDLRISMNYVEYDEPTLKISTESSVVIDDRDMRITGDMLDIFLRPRPAGVPGGTAGFNGAKNAFLKKNVHIVINNVGSSGILPGPSTASQRDGDKTPLDLRCDGVMKIDLPEPAAPVRVGPPAPSGPTLVEFDRNVEVLRGKAGQIGADPDKLNCDHLRLILVPASKDPEAPPKTPAEPKGAIAALPPGETQPPPAAPEDGGPLTDLTLREAYATGHNVRIVSAAQGVKARCNDLTHRKLQPESPDITYLRGDATTKVVVNKDDVAQTGPRKGQVTSTTTIRTIDVTIEDRGQGNDDLTIIARGPDGILETRPGRDKPVEQTARWTDSLIVENEPAPAPKLGAKAKTKEKDAAAFLKRITLTGNASFSDAPTKTVLTADRNIIVWLRPKEKPAEPVAVQPKATAAHTAAAPAKTETAAQAPATGSDSFDIERLVALVNVHLTAPARTLTARDRLDADFSTLAPDPAASKPPPSTAKSLAVAAPKTSGAASAEEKKASKPAEPTKPADPDARAIANRVYARLLIRPAAEGERETDGGAALASRGAAGRTEIDQVRLRGGVVYDADPERGKERGTHVIGEAVDVDGRGPGLSQFVVFNWDPEAAKHRKVIKPEDLEFAPLARVDTEEMTILGADIGLDQGRDIAWVDGLGSMTQMTERGLFSDKGVANPAPDDPKAKTKPKPSDNTGSKERPQLSTAAAAPSKKTPMTIHFTRGMLFYGRPVKSDSVAARLDFARRKFSDRDAEPEEWPAARAEFYQNVQVRMEDSRVDCRDKMIVYMDRPVSLAHSNRPGATTEADDDATTEADAKREPTPQTDIALVECVEKVRVTDRKVDPDGRRDAAGNIEVLERKDIEGDYLIYDKATGKFRVPGAGKVFLYQRDGQGDLALEPGARDGRTGPAQGGGDSGGAAGPGTRVIRRTALNEPPPVVGRNNATSRAATDLSGTRTKGQAKAKAKAAQEKAKAILKKAEVKPPLPPLILTQIKFTREMVGRFGSGKDSDKTDTRWADFFGQVDSIRAKVSDADTRLDPDRPPPDAQTLNARVLRVISNPVFGKSQPEYYLTAWDNAFATTDKKSIQADKITYASATDLFYAYGEDGRDVLFGEQRVNGMAASPGRTKTLRYNHKTGETDLFEPKTFAVFDPNTGARPAPAKPVDPDVAPKWKRKPFLNPRANIERGDFSGH